MRWFRRVFATLAVLAFAVSLTIGVFVLVRHGRPPVNDNELRAWLADALRPAQEERDAY